MSIIIPNQINRSDHRIYSRNPICRIPIRVTCVYCVNTGNLAIIKNVWKLNMHYRKQHGRENFQETVQTVMDKVCEGLKQ